MRKARAFHAFLATVTLLMLGLAVSACGSAPLPLEDEPYRSEEGGFMIRYPRGWAYEEVRLGGNTSLWLTVFAESAEVIGVGGNPLSTTVAVNIYVGTKSVSDAKDSREMLDAIISARTLTGQDDIQYGPVQDVQLAGEAAAWAEVDLTYREAGLRGRVVCVKLGERGICLSGSSLAGDWEAFLPTFQAMQDSMSFFEPQE